MKSQILQPLTILLSAALAMTVNAADAKTTETKLITADGSSTVFPITAAIAEEYQKQNPNIRVTVGISGTGGGFKRFTRGETDISNASRPITQEEIAAATKGKINFIELPVAYDGIAIIVNPKNDFVATLTVDELKRIWQPESTVKLWSDIRPSWPARKIKLYGPGTDSGTFDYFTKAINGKEKACRSDFTSSEDDNTLVTGVAGDRDALGYFGYSYFEANQSKLKLVGVDAGKGAVLPSVATITDATYAPLSRPIFIYVNTAAVTRAEVSAFITFYLKEVAGIVRQVGYVPLNPAVSGLTLARFEARTAGSIFTTHGSQLSVKLEQMLSGSKKPMKKPEVEKAAKP